MAFAPRDGALPGRRKSNWRATDDKVKSMDAMQSIGEAIYRRWWMVLLRGLAGIIFGIITFVAPGSSATALVIIFGAYAFADGLVLLASAANPPLYGEPRWPLVLNGLAGLAIGIVTFVRPAATALGLVWLIAVWALFTGVLELVAAIRLRRVIRGEWLLALGGIASIVLGVLLLGSPGAGLLTLVIWMGVYVLAFGVLLTVLAFRLRTMLRPGAGLRDLKAVRSR